MRYLVLVLGTCFLIGCSTKVIVKKQNPSVQMQKQDAQKAWRDLDNQ
jgi:uncharacterized protein YceK